MSMFVRAALVAMLSLNIYSLANSAGADKPKLEGQHQIIAGERNGKPLNEADFKGATFRFTADKVTGANKNGTEFLAAEYTLDAGKTPCVIVMKLTAGTDKGKEMRGLIERKDDTIRIIYSAPGGEAPKDFKTKAGQAMYTLKVEKK
ncbi:MAG: TIGR03067 domain-containing protein [Planctomycetia bacterium]|nr:TIGR03067 domain-containing protein [Planctomycetia bacterium]